MHVSKDKSVITDGTGCYLAISSFRHCMFFSKISDVLSNSWGNIWFLSVSVMTNQLVSYCLFCNRTSQIGGCYERKGIKVCHLLLIVIFTNQQNIFATLKNYFVENSPENMKWLTTFCVVFFFFFWVYEAERASSQFTLHAKFCASGMFPCFSEQHKGVFSLFCVLILFLNEN